MNKTLLTVFIKTLNVESAYRYLTYFGYSFTKEEINLLLPYLKNNIELLDKEHKEELMKNLPSNTSKFARIQLSQLFDRFI